MIKLQYTPPPAPDSPDADTPNDSSQDYVSTDFYLQYSLRNRKFPPYSTNATKK